MSQAGLQGTRVMLSASVPDELSGTPRAQELYRALTVLSRAVAMAGGRLTFAGHPSITPVMDRAVEAIGVDRDFVRIYQAAHFRPEALPEVLDPERFPNLRWIGDPSDERPAALTAMRTAMAQESDAAIFIGGRAADEKRPVPGLREEYRLFRQHRPNAPIYLLGLLDGEARRMIDDVERGELKEPNGLSAKERELVHHGDLIELIAPLISRDMARWLLTPNRKDVPSPKPS